MLQLQPTVTPGKRKAKHNVNIRVCCFCHQS